MIIIINFTISHYLTAVTEQNIEAPAETAIIISAEIRSAITVRRLTFARDRFETPRLAGCAVDEERCLSVDQVAIVAGNVHFGAVNVLVAADGTRAVGEVDSLTSAHCTTHTV